VGVGGDGECYVTTGPAYRKCYCTTIQYFILYFMHLRLGLHRVSANFCRIWCRNASVIEGIVQTVPLGFGL